MKSVQNSL